MKSSASELSLGLLSPIKVIQLGRILIQVCNFSVKFCVLIVCPSG